MIASSPGELPNLTVHVGSGLVTGQELRDVAMGFVRDAPTPLALWDFSQADLSALSTESLVKIFDALLPYVHHRQGGRSALLVSSTVGFGLGRLSEALAEVRDFPYQVKVFSDREDAMLWLELTENGEDGADNGEGAA